MGSKKFLIIALIGVFGANALKAQEELPGNWNSEKIRGIRFLPDANYLGTPFSFDDFLKGEIELEDGSMIGNLLLKYNNYRDELIYYNSTISTQIVVDKTSIIGFSFNDANGINHLFRKLTYNGPMPGDRFFEILSEGDVTLLVYRKILLLSCPIYGEPGKEKNMSYQEAFSYYLYNLHKGFESVKPEKKSILSKFEKSDQKTVRKLLQQSKISIKDENSLVKGWNLIKGNAGTIHF